MGEVVGVFGANGFIGRSLVRRLLGDGRRVIAYGRSFPVDYPEIVGAAVETRVIDFGDVLATHAALQDVRSVVQLVNSSSPGLGNTRAVADLQANVLPHVAFIESCLLSGISSFVFLSSGGTVYGEPSYLPLDEDHPLLPINSYGLTKMIGEQYLRMLTRGTPMNAISLRVSNPFGPGQQRKKGQGLIAAILRNHADGLPVTIFGDGSVARDYLYIEDLIDALLLAIDTPAMRETFNIGSGVGRSVLEVVAAVERAIGERLAIEFVNDRPTDAKANVLDCSRAAERLGWRATTDFDEALARTVAAWR